MRSIRRVVILLVALATLLPGMPAAAQSPAPTLDPLVCGSASALHFPLRDPGVTLVTPFAFPDPLLPNPDTRFPGRFTPFETWANPAIPGGLPVYAAGPGMIVANGLIGAGDRGGIIVVQHTGKFLLPASTFDDPFILGGTVTDSLLTVYAGIDAVPLPVGTCVTETNRWKSDSLVPASPSTG